MACFGQIEDEGAPVGVLTVEVARLGVLEDVDAVVGALAGSVVAGVLEAQMELVGRLEAFDDD